jgi:tRNA G18 (ribose-2'-O)-methylase SpoU
MYDFTKTKFLTLPFKRQHKKCAELLRHIYDNYLVQGDWKKDWQIYEQLLQWMNEPVADAPTLKTISDCYHVHQQKGEISQKEHRLLPQIRRGDRLQSEDAWPIAIYLDHLRSAHNVGSIIRTVEAFALGTLYFSSETPFITHKQVQDTAMGSIEWVSCHQDITLSSLPRPIIGLETTPQALSLNEFVFPSTFTLVVGNEEYGCSDETLELADYLVEIPLRGHKNSLNVANAFAITAGEISRQKCLNVKGVL